MKQEKTSMLTDTALRNLNPKSLTYKVSDRDGMYVTVSPAACVTFYRQPKSGAAVVPATVFQPRGGTMSATSKLRLGPLPKTESIKLTFACPATLKVDLDRYAALHAQAYGDAVDAMMLIPYMLEAFMAGDRGFRRKSSGQG
jgi:hypothetical protein